MSYREQHEHHFKTLSSIRPPRVIAATAWLMAGFIILVGAFLLFTPWIQTANGQGKLIALDPNDRLQEINALVSGRIQEWYVRDGSQVKVGDPIVKIVDNDPLLLERLQAERFQVMAKLEAAETAVTTAEIDMRRTDALFEDGLAARRELELARIKVEELKAKVAEAAAELTRADVNLSRQSVQLVRAPRDGVILRVNAGDTATFISAGDPVATFVPDNAGRAVELFIDGRDIALVKAGAMVSLQFEGWPVVQFSGWPSLAIGMFSGKVVAVDPSAQADGRFRILIGEVEGDNGGWPASNYLRYGSKARGWVLLEQVSVGYELWRQLNNFPPDYPVNASPVSL